MLEQKVLITGGAGLVGQNLIPRLKASGTRQIVVIDKHASNIATLRRLHPGVKAIHADMAEPGEWEPEMEGCGAVVIAHAQIGGVSEGDYVRNNVTATERLLEAISSFNVPYLVNISSSVVNSMAADDYVVTKKAQEALVLASGIDQVVLRPTLMFGWFDRKHVGWLARFMKRSPLFPIPGNGRYLRQPLYAGDFCDIILSSIERRITGAYNITGLERIDYIDLIRSVKDVTGARSAIVKLPYRLFSWLLALNALWDKNPPFTVKQLQALVTPDVFEVIDWPGIFHVRPTPLREALKETFQNPRFSNIDLDF